MVIRIGQPKVLISFETLGQLKSLSLHIKGHFLLVWTIYSGWMGTFCTPRNEQWVVICEIVSLIYFAPTHLSSSQCVWERERERETDWLGGWARQRRYGFWLACSIMQRARLLNTCNLHAKRTHSLVSCLGWDSPNSFFFGRRGWLGSRDRHMRWDPPQTL